jgi:citrate synthase
VQRLKERKEAHKNPGIVAEHALHLGTAVMESAITLIAEDRFYYRGYDALALARTHTVEQVASLIWTGDFSTADSLFSRSSLPNVSPHYHMVRQQLTHLTPLEAFEMFLPLVAREDLMAYDFRPSAVAQAGARILQALAAIAVDDYSSSESIAQTLAAKLINTTLILCADQELSASTFAACCAASAGSSPYSVVKAGLATLQGVKHVGYCEHIEAFLREVGSPTNARQSIANRLKRGEEVPGFGHPLYPSGDPRGQMLLQLVTTAYPDSPAVTLASTVAEEARKLLGEHPHINFGLVALSQALNLPPGGPIALFALGRTIGWIGHAIEQYQANQLIRPRARYIGEQPVEEG